MVVWLGKNVAKCAKGNYKLQPNGIEVGVSEVWRIPTDSTAIFDGKQREVCKEKVTTHGDFYILDRGTYEVRVGVKVKIPANCVGLCLPRSTINRLGIIKSETALWDSGYEGFGTQTIHVPIKQFKIHKDENWFQLIFISNESPSELLYEGHWQNEAPKRPFP